jgi:hypothetical protein
VALFKTTSEVSVDNDAANKAKQLSPWKIAIIDDEPGIHDVTKFALSHFELEGRKLAFIQVLALKMDSFYYAMSLISRSHLSML